MKIKVSQRFINSITPNLIRDWCEALIGLPGVEYITEQSGEYADIGIVKNYNWSHKRLSGYTFNKPVLVGKVINIPNKHGKITRYRVTHSTKF